MHLAWLYLLHAEFIRDGTDVRYREKKNPRRLVKIDGEPKLWELERCLRERWIDPKDPVRANISFFIALRNKIEHRYARVQRSLELSLSGHVQAHLVNFEDELTAQFGADYSLAEKIRFPVFVGTFTQPGTEALKALQSKLPRKLKDFIEAYHTSLDPDVEKDQRFALRLRVTLDLANRGPADMAIKFTRFEDLTPGQIQTLEEIGRTGAVIQRDRIRNVRGHGEYSPAQIAKIVNDAIPFTFNRAHVTSAWKRNRIRPPKGDAHPELTDEKYCTWDARHGDYGYTEAWVKKLIRECSTREGFINYIGREPPEH